MKSSIFYVFFYLFFQPQEESLRPPEAPKKGSRGPPGNPKRRRSGRARGPCGCNARKQPGNPSFLRLEYMEYWEIYVYVTCIGYIPTISFIGIYWDMMYIYTEYIYIYIYSIYVYIYIYGIYIYIIIQCIYSIYIYVIIYVYM